MHAVATFLFEIKIRITLSCSKVSMTLVHRLCMSICTIAHNYTALNALGNPSKKNLERMLVYRN